MPSSEDRIICEFEKKVTEIDLMSLESLLVYTATDDEVVQAVQYSALSDTLTIIVTHIPKDDNSLPKKPRAFEYKKLDIQGYILIAWYELPYLHKENLNKFSPFYKEVYTQPRSDGDKVKLNADYFLNHGIFINCDDDITEAMSVTKHYEHDTAAGRTEEFFLNPHVTNFVIGDVPALVTFLLEDNDAPLIQILQFSEADNAVVAINNNELIVLKYNNGRYNEISRFSHSDLGEHGSPADGAIIQGTIVYFWKLPNSLYSYNIVTKDFTDYECIIPGLSVFECDFRNARMSSVIKKSLDLHKGKI
jgi:hypothetical protein